MGATAAAAAAKCTNHFGLFYLINFGIPEHDECMNNFGSKPEEKRSVGKFEGVIENNTKVQFTQLRYGTVA